MADRGPFLGRSAVELAVDAVIPLPSPDQIRTRALTAHVRCLRPGDDAMALLLRGRVLRDLLMPRTTVSRETIHRALVASGYRLTGR